jgi:hypothetical protein
MPVGILARRAILVAPPSALMLRELALVLRFSGARLVPPKFGTPGPAFAGAVFCWRVVEPSVRDRLLEH